MDDDSRDRFTVDGYVDGPNLGSTQDGSRFIISKAYGERPEKFVTIPKIGALPSYCPWIVYKLTLEKPQKGSIYSVVSIDSCRARQVHKKDVIDHIVIARKMDKKLVKDRMKKLSHQISSLEEIDRDVEDPKMKRDLVTILKTAFKPPIYFELLKYFSSTFLMRFSDEQLLAIAITAVKAPYTFCFWDHARRILLNLTVDGKKMFPNGDSGEDYLAMDDSYAHVMGEILLRRGKKEANYSSKFPVWSLDSAERGCMQWMHDLFDSVDKILKPALAIYLEMDKGFYSFGNTCLSLKRTTGISSEAISFMIKEGIVRFALGDEGRRDILIKPHNELVEINIASMMERKFIRVMTVDCPFYGTSYIKLFTDWIRQSAIMDKALLISANGMTASYMKTSTGLDFMACDDVEKKHFSGKTHLVIDKLQKISVVSFRALMSLAKGGMTMCALGDSTDYCVNSRRGGGDVLGPLFERFSPERWHRWETSDPMRKVHECLCNQGGIILSNIHPIPLDKPKAVLEHVKFLEKKPGCDHLSHNVFCSSEKDWKFMMEVMCKKIGGNECTFDKHSFMMGQKVHVMEDDSCGILSGASDENEPKISLNVKEVNLLRGRYRLDIGGKKYSTTSKTIKHADAHVITKFHGAPAPYGIFYVTEDTNRKHLWCAAKYCLTDLIVFVKPGMNIGDVKPPWHKRPENDLYSKLKRMKIK